MEQMPENVRAILASNETNDLVKLAEQADRMMEVLRPQMMSVSQNSHIEAVNRGRSPNNHNPATIEELRQVIEKLAVKVDQLSTPRGRSRSQSRSNHSHSNSATTTSISNALCYFHHRFGNDARKCQPPCAWKNTSAQGN